MDHGHKIYGLSFKEEDEFGKRAPVHKKTSGMPTSMKNYRYTIEDGRCCIRAATFAKAIRVKVRTIKGYAQQTINLLGEKKNIKSNDMILMGFGMGGLTSAQIRKKYTGP